MNSETPQNHESEINQSPEFIEISEDEITLEERDNSSEQFPDIWSTSDDDIIDVEPDVEVVAKTTETQGESGENQSEFEPWLEQETKNLESEDDAIAKTQNSTHDNQGESGENQLEFEPWLEQEAKNLESEDDAIAESDNSSSQFSEEVKPESELVADSWLDESESAKIEASSPIELEKEQNKAINELERQKAQLEAEIEQIKAQKTQLLLQQVREAQEMMGRMVEEGMKELKARKNSLQIEIEKLERRRERINQEMRTNFAGASQELAVKVQGFKDYLVGSLQDLALAAEQLELNRVEAPQPPRQRSRGQEPRRERRESIKESRRKAENSSSPSPQFTEQAFAEQTKRIRSLIERYRTRPDYYGSPWQLRRTFEPVHATKVQDWFFSQGGRGAIDSMGSRLQNILVASAIISIMHNLYGDRCKVLVLIDTPEKLGEWRRGLQDCLGIARSDFGTNRGVVLFDAAEVLAQRAERLVKEKQLPLIIIDETEELVNLSLLKFPLWLAFASGAKPTSSNYLY